MLLGVFWSEQHFKIIFSYDPATGIFIVSPNGEGYYLFVTHFTMQDEIAYIDIRVNGEAVCSLQDMQDATTNDSGNAGCSAVVLLSEDKSHSCVCINNKSVKMSLKH